jgi:hypothetical protein
MIVGGKSLESFGKGEQPFAVLSWLFARIVLQTFVEGGYPLTSLAVIDYDRYKLLVIWYPKTHFAEWVYWGNGYVETSRFLKDRGFVKAASDYQWERDLFVGPADADLRDMPYQG